ncbi:MAG TPA: glutathione S-transferase family protein [Steroidobacteraceae bacterium]|nr:glutathione S-transferase family protein [Steroidobacteraceae bacterium]
MILIGMFDSPFVRRVAVSMKLLGIAFEHRNWSVGKDFDQIRKYNPVGRVPTLVLDDGEALMESSAILDFLDERAGPERALMPRSGRERRTALRLMAMTTGAAEKGVAQIYEGIFRPTAKRHEPWVERCRAQMHGALHELERWSAARGPGKWLVADRMTQADITLACIWTFLTEAPGLDVATAPYDSLRSLAARCEALPEFSSTHVAYFVPKAAG